MCPLDQFNCSAHFIWSNLNLSPNITLINNFSKLLLCNLYMSFSQYFICYIDTSQIQTIDIIPITNGIRYQCNFLPHSIVWGCAIIATNSTNNVNSSAPQNMTTHIANNNLLNISPGEYTIIVLISCNKTFFDYNQIILQMTISVNGTNYRTISSSSSLNSKFLTLSITPSIAGN